MGIDCITVYDWNRSYVLPDHVDSNIPRRGSIGGYGAHNYARALLVEVCRFTGSAPISLHYADHETADTDISDDAVSGDGGLLVITATAARPDGTLLVVTTRTRNRRVDNLDGDWSITVNGRRYLGEDRCFPPSPPYQGLLVRWLTHSPA